MEDEEYIYDDDYPRKYNANSLSLVTMLTPVIEQPPMQALGWDGLNPDIEDQLVMMEHQNNRRRLLARMDRSPFPPGFMVGNSRDFGGMFNTLVSDSVLLIRLLRFPKLLLPRASRRRTTIQY